MLISTILFTIYNPQHTIFSVPKNSRFMNRPATCQRPSADLPASDGVSFAVWGVQSLVFNDSFQSCLNGGASSSEKWT